MSLEPQMKSITEGMCAVSYSSNRYMEFNKIGVDKGEGLKHLAQIIGVDLSECIAVGDNYNDLPMLKCVDIPITLNTSPQPLKDISQLHVESVAQAIKELL